MSEGTSSRSHPTDTNAALDQRIDDSYNTVAGSPLVSNLQSLDRGHSRLRWFRGGPTPFGVLAVSVALAGARSRSGRGQMISTTRAVDPSSPPAPSIKMQVPRLPERRTSAHTVGAVLNQAGVGPPRNQRSGNGRTSSRLCRLLTSGLPASCLVRVVDALIERRVVSVGWDLDEVPSDIGPILFIRHPDGRSDDDRTQPHERDDRRPSPRLSVRASRTRSPPKRRRAGSSTTAHHSSRYVTQRHAAVRERRPRIEDHSQHGQPGDEHGPGTVAAPQPDETRYHGDRESGRTRRTPSRG